MLIGFWEIVLIMTVFIIIFVPSFLKRRGNLYANVRVYAIIAVLLLIIFILTRIVFTLIGKIMALTTILFLVVALIAMRYLRRPYS
jgi:hypothetical protein